MARERRVLRIEREGARWIVRSPLVGRIALLPSRGSYLEAGGAIGTMTVLQREIDLVMPDDARGVVIERMLEGKHPWVEWGQPLLRLAESLDLAGTGAAHDGAVGTGAAMASSSGDADVPAGLLAVRAPTDGLFYRRPGPDSPPYVSEGDAVEPGTTLGLVEVMKCFNPIVYGKDGTSRTPGTIEKIFAADGGEVRGGQVLILVRPRA